MERKNSDGLKSRSPLISAKSKQGEHLTSKSKKVYIRTFGCQMNKRDSEIVQGILQEKGFGFVDDEKDADIVLFNTCSVRKHAEQRAMSIMGTMVRKKKDRKDRIFGLMGCVAQHKKKDVFKSLPKIDFICGPADIYRIADIISDVLTKRQRIIAVSGDRTSRPVKHVNPYHRESETHAYVNIMYGCDNFCSYCIVPYVRGKEVSRPAKDIVKEISELIERGVKDITLLGQNVNSYSDGEAHFVELLTMINSLKGLKMLSFVTSHPKDAGVKLFKAMRDLDRITPILHLPIQSGSDKILKAMNRGYTAAKYMDLVKKYRETVPNGNISTDIIVGFPGETSEDFELTKKIFKEIKFDAAYIFKYSPRPPAKASLLNDDVSFGEKKRRNNELLDIHKEIIKTKKGQIK